MDEKITKNCPFCGEVILEVAKKCKHCKEFLDTETKEYPLSETMNNYSELSKMENAYFHLPWFRKSSYNSMLTFIGMLIFPPFLWFVCIICLTGEIYYEDKDQDGNLKTWGMSNKIAAVIVLALQIFIIIAFIQNPK